MAQSVGTVKGFQALPFQQEYLNHPARFVIVEGATKIGKTYPFAYKIFKHTTKNNYPPGSRLWWVGPISRQSEIAYQRLERKVRASPLYKCISSKGQQSITYLPNECMLEFRSADSPNSLYGDDVYEVVCDEITRWPKASWDAVYSTLTATNGKADLIGNYRGESHWVRQLAIKQKDNPDWAYFRIPFLTAVRAGLRTMQQYDRARQDSTDLLTFKRLYDCEDVEDNSQIITMNAIHSLFTNPYPKKSGTMYLTADIAMQGADMFTVFVWDDFAIVDIVTMPKSDGKQVEDTIRSLCEQYTIPLQHVCYDADGLGGYLQGYLKSAKPFHNGGSPIAVKGQKLRYTNLKAQVQHEYGQIVNKGWIAFTPDALSKIELETKGRIVDEHRYVKNANHGTDDKFALPKKTFIKEQLGYSPDYLDGMALRAYFEVGKSDGFFVF